MAREFILFVHICHWMGGKTAVPFKTFPSWLTECHRGKMETPGGWGQAWTPTGLNKRSNFFVLPWIMASFHSVVSSVAQEGPCKTHAYIG